MAEKGTMTAAFEPTPEVRELLEGKSTEHIVVNPVAVEAKFEDGRVVRYPQDIRERIVRFAVMSSKDVYAPHIARLA